MADRALLDVDESGKRTIFAEEDGIIRIERYEDVTALIEANKRKFNDPAPLNRTFVEIGDIPGTVLHAWCREDGVDYFLKENLKKLVAKLEQRDNRVFKTHPGRFA